MGNTQGKPGGGTGSGNNWGAGSALGNNTGTFEPGKDFWEFNPRNIAGLNGNLRLASRGAANLFGAGSGATNAAQGLFGQLSRPNANLNQAMNLATQYSGGKLPSAFGDVGGLLSQLRGVSQRQVTGANLGSDPALAAARRNFAVNTAGNLENAAAAAGLGRSNTAINALGNAQAAADVPFIQDALGREERGIGREMTALDRAIASKLGIGQSQLASNDAAVRSLLTGAGQEASQTASAAQGLAGVGGQQFNQLLNSVQANQGVGTANRQINQEILDAPYDEQMRLYGEALNSMYGPLGMIGSLLGSSSTSSKK